MQIRHPIRLAAAGVMAAAVLVGVMAAAVLVGVMAAAVLVGIMAAAVPAGAVAFPCGRLTVGDEVNHGPFGRMI